MSIDFTMFNENRQERYLPAVRSESPLVSVWTRYFDAHTDDSAQQFRPVPDFPLDVFPRYIQALVIAGAILYGVSISIAAVGVLMMAAAYLGRSRYLDNPPYRTFSSLWLLLVARPGSGKSHLIDRLFKRFRSVGRKNTPPLAAFITDFSMAGLLDELEEGKNGAFILADEAIDMMMRVRNEKGMPKLATLYDNNPVVKVRSKRTCCGSCPYHTQIDSPTLNLLGCIQPKRLPSIFTQSDIDGGFAARYLLVWAESVQKWDIDGVDMGALNHSFDACLDQLHARLLSMQEASFADGQFQPVKVTLDAAAQGRIKDWTDYNETKKAQRINCFEESIYAKIPRQAMSGMLSLYALVACMSGQPETFIIDDDLAAKGLRLADWLLANQQFSWTFLNPGMKREYSPIHGAIAKAIVEHTDIPFKNKGIFPMPKMVELVKGYLGRNIDNRTVGVAATALGLETATERRVERGRLIKKSTLRKMAFILEIAPRMTEDDDLLVAGC